MSDKKPGIKTAVLSLARPATSIIFVPIIFFFLFLSRQIRVCRDCRDRHVLDSTKHVPLTRRKYTCCEKSLRNKYFDATSLLLSQQSRVCRDKTRLLSRQKYICRDKRLVSTNVSSQQTRVCRDFFFCLDKNATCGSSRQG